jgi:hypothetical protein
VRFFDRASQKDVEWKDIQLSGSVAKRKSKSESRSAKVVKYMSSVMAVTDQKGIGSNAPWSKAEPSKINVMMTAHSNPSPYAYIFIYT